MKSNIGSIDKIIRYALAVVLVALSLSVFKVQEGNWIGYALVAVAAIFVITAMISWCPIWAIFRVKTNKA
jgi:hypothetical protein